MNKGSVLQPWVEKLSWKEQTGLISAVRGIDDTEANGYDDLKKITKMLRYLILNNADNKTEFMTDKIMEADYLKSVLNIEASYVKNSKYTEGHWYAHILLAIKIIMNKHPNPYTKKYWAGIYDKLEVKDYKELTEKNTTA